MLSRIVPDMSATVLSSQLSVHGIDVELGTENGPCSFTVNGVTGDEMETMSTDSMKAIALQHLNTFGKVLVIGRANEPISLYDNPQAYPQIFPWLFSYGMGGVGLKIHKNIFSESKIKKHLLMYYDKRFQLDHLLS